MPHHSRLVRVRANGRLACLSGGSSMGCHQQRCSPRAADCRPCGRIAEGLNVNPDAFLTPIRHKNNIIIMGPGGYKFGDYWRLGRPLEIVVLIVGLPAVVTFWPL